MLLKVFKEAADVPTLFNVLPRASVPDHIKYTRISPIAAAPVVVLSQRTGHMSNPLVGTLQ
jgi:hypothetical protein